MDNEFPPDIQAMIDMHLANGRYKDANAVIRDALDALRFEEENVAAVQEAIAQWQAGDDGLPLDEAFDEVKRKLGLTKPD